MIFGDTKYLSAYRRQLPEKIYACLAKVRAFDFSRPDGKYEIEGAGVMSVDSPMTEPAEARKLEGHKNFIDVVYLIEGEEWIGIEPKDAQEEVETHEDRDLYFFHGKEEEESRVHMRPGRFLICWPEDLHRPLCMTAEGEKRIRKAVVKVSCE